MYFMLALLGLNQFLMLYPLLVVRVIDASDLFDESLNLCSRICQLLVSALMHLSKH